MKKVQMIISAFGPDPPIASATDMRSLPFHFGKEFWVTLPFIINSNIIIIMIIIKMRIPIRICMSICTKILVYIQDKLVSKVLWDLNKASIQEIPPEFNLNVEIPFMVPIVHWEKIQKVHRKANKMVHYGNVPYQLQEPFWMWIKLIDLFELIPNLSSIPMDQTIIVQCAMYI